MEKSIKKSMANPMKKQQGMTLISWIIVLVFLLFQGVIAMNVLPVYLTDSNVKKIMTALSYEFAPLKKTIKDVCSAYKD